MELALKCGGSPSKILFSGPGKTEVELLLALKAGISEIHVESFEEINRLALLSKHIDRAIPVVIRFNPSEVVRGGAMVMGGKPTAFGIDEEMIVEAVEKVLRSDRLTFQGLHCYSGTQIVDYDVIVDMYEHYIEFASKISDHFNVPFKTLDFGGGFGIPYFDTDITLDMDSLCEGLKPLIRHARSKKGLENTRFIIEPGRFLVGEGGLYIARVLDIKKSRNEKFMVLDGGMNHHIVAAGHFGHIIKRNIPIAVANKMDGTV